MKYSVSIGYNEFCFNDGQTALSFAALAVKHMVVPEGAFGKSDVIILVVNDEKDKEEDNHGMDV